MAIAFFCREAGVELWLEHCVKCKTPFAMSKAVYTIAVERRESVSFYCPNGHNQHYVSGETEADILRRERDRLKQNEAFLRDLIERERRAAAATRGNVTKLRKRISAGVCPCCNRTVSQLARHMATKHPGFKAEEISSDG